MIGRTFLLFLVLMFPTVLCHVISGTLIWTYEESPCLNAALGHRWNNRGSNFTLLSSPTSSSMLRNILHVVALGLTPLTSTMIRLVRVLSPMLVVVLLSTRIPS